MIKSLTTITDEGISVTRHDYPNGGMELSVALNQQIEEAKKQGANIIFASWQWA